VDPALAYFDDGDISKLVTKPGGLNAGLVNEDGHLLVQPIPSGGNHMLGRDIQESERAVVKSAFLEDFFRVLTDPGDRWTATQVLEMVATRSVLIAPFADRYETEKVGVLVERVLDILMRAGQIAPMPPEMTEANARPLVYMKNPLARMARAGEAAAFTRWVEIGVQAAGAGRPEALDRVNFDGGMVGVGEVLGVRPSWIVSDDELAALRAQREQKEQAAALAQVVPDAAGAALSLAKANQIGDRRARRWRRSRLMAGDPFIRRSAAAAMNLLRNATMSRGSIVQARFHARRGDRPRRGDRSRGPARPRLRQFDDIPRGSLRRSAAPGAAGSMAADFAAPQPGRGAGPEARGAR
jgi:hypothetical protein